MANEYRVVFKGTVLEGFDPEAVRSKAASKLKASPEQIQRLFTGRASVLKKGISAELGERYVKELTRIGMQVRLEAMPAAEPAPAPAPIVPPPSDLEKTQLADPLALSRYLQADNDPASAPTLIVPPPRRTEILSEQGLSAADIPTMIVSPAQRAAAAPTVVIRQEKGSHDPERTLIANPAALDAYFKTDNSNPQPAASPTQSQFPGGAPLDPHKTELNPNALEAYLAANPQPAAAPATQAVREVKVSVAEDFNRDTAEQAVAVFAPSGPFAAPPPAPPLSPSLRDEYEEDAGTTNGQDARQRKIIKIAAGLAAVLLLLWLIL